MACGSRGGGWRGELRASGDSAARDQRRAVKIDRPRRQHVGDRVGLEVAAERRIVLTMPVGHRSGFGEEILPRRTDVQRRRAGDRARRAMGTISIMLMQSL